MSRYSDNPAEDGNAAGRADARRADQEIRETIRQMLKDWNSATPEQRADALAKSATMAEKAGR